MSAGCTRRADAHRQGKGITVEPVGSNSGGRSSRRRMLQMVGAAAAIPAFSSLGAGAPRWLRRGGPSPTGPRAAIRSGR